MLSPEIVLSKMSVEEKAALCDGADFWHLKAFKKYGIDEQVMLCDGPHGLRKKDYSKSGSSLTSSVPAICFPTAVTTACSWDPDLLYEMGQALGKKCKKEQVSVILGPGVNMKRSPLCGRNFEYFSEDPVLAGELAAGLINGVQSMGVGTSLKHFCANTQETRRMTVDSVIDERALREIYLTAFETAVKKGKPWTVMNSYNKINGAHGSENYHTLTEILRNEWGYDGVVVSDWGAVNNRADGLAAGNDLEMPSSNGQGAKKIVEAVKSGKISEETLNERALNILKLIQKSLDNLDYGFEYFDAEHQPLARKIARESIVLMKNEGILPLNKEQKIAFIGDMAKNPRYQGAGSSQINPTKIDSAFDEFKYLGFDIEYEQGYERTEKKAKNNPFLIKKAVSLAQRCDVAVVFIGLTEEYESEGYDRQNMLLPSVHNELIDEILRVNKNVVVVLAGGSPVEMPWCDNVKAILNSYLGGQAVGGAVADILSGKYNPCGKLAETYPVDLASTPCAKYFPGNEATTEHRESIFIGYRYYDTAGVPVRYPFGHGLSYTSFEYSDLTLSKKRIKDTDELTVKFKVKNTGDRAGAEIAQLYVSDRVTTIFRPKKELKAFKKVFLEKGEEKEVELVLDRRAFAFFNTITNDWCVEGGVFDILVGASVEDIRLSRSVQITAPKCEIPDYKKTAPAYYTADVQSVPDEQFECVLGRPIPPRQKDSSLPVDITDCFESARYTKNGKTMYDLLSKVIPEGFARGIALQTPFRDFISMSGGVFDETMADGLIKLLNGEKGGVRTMVKHVPMVIKGIGPLMKQI